MKYKRSFNQHICIHMVVACACAMVANLWGEDSALLVQNASRYSDPSVEKMQLVMLGVSQLSEDDGSGAPQRPIEKQLFEQLSSDKNRAKWTRLLELYLKSVAGRFPDLGVKVVSVDNQNEVDSDISNAAFAILALNRVIQIDTHFEGGTVDSTLYISLPWFIVQAQSWELLHAEPLLVKVKLPGGVAIDDGKLIDPIFKALAEVFENRLSSTEAPAQLERSLRRGAYKDVDRPMAEIPKDGITFSDGALSEESGFQTPEMVADFLKEVASFYMSESIRCLPPMQQSVQQPLFEDAVGRHFKLSAVTDLGRRMGLPVVDSGRVNLAVKMPPASYQMKLHVKTGLGWAKETEYFKYGKAGVALEVSKVLASSQRILKTITVSAEEGIKLSKTEQNRPAERYLFKAAFMAAGKLRTVNIK